MEFQSATKKPPTINIINQDSWSLNKDIHLVFQMFIFHGLVACRKYFSIGKISFPLQTGIHSYSIYFLNSHIFFFILAESWRLLINI